MSEALQKRYLNREKNKYKQIPFLKRKPREKNFIFQSIIILAHMFEFVKVITQTPTPFPSPIS
jgi:hypothetical protein